MSKETAEEKKVTEETQEELSEEEKEEKEENAGESEEKDEEDTSEESKESEEDDEFKDKYLRLMAEFQNYKKRTARERQDIYDYANEKLVTELLTVVDNFERGLGQKSEDEKFAEGMKLIFDNLKDVLEKAGLDEIDAEGEDFDPNFHNAVMMEDNDDFESGKVTCVLQKGYTLNEKVIRPSMVKVNN